MKLLYFAWLKQKIGTGEEDIPLPDGVTNVGALVSWLKAQGPGYGEALEDLSVIRFAVNQEFVDLDHALAEGDEVAIFPPVTGG
ncbi:MAG: molybdopterin converting factor subunit 1 [Rhodospirillaceae bacterium]|nr:molybdopterin converting factor subunit 1 [Rhodospirillaceae bacterium]